MQKNLFKLLMLAMTLVSCGKDAKLASQNLSSTPDLIVNGEAVEGESYKSVVGLVDSSTGRIFCTGNVFRENHVITAVHCLLPVSYNTESLNATASVVFNLGKTLNSSLNDLADMIEDQDLMRTIFLAMANARAKTFGIHVGNGKNGLNSQVPVSFVTGVERAILRDETLDMVIEIFTSTVKKALGQEVEVKGLDSHLDHFVLKLNNGSLDVKPTPLVTKEQFEQYVRRGQVQVFTVGFGVKIDPISIQEITETISLLKKMLSERAVKKEVLEVIYNYFLRKTASLYYQNNQAQIAQTAAFNDYSRIVLSLKNIIDNSESEEIYNEIEQFGQYLEEIRSNGQSIFVSSGNKNYVQLGVATADIEGIVELTSINPTVSAGACFGDSGGPSFVKIDGKNYQFATTSGGLVCGSVSSMSPVHSELYSL